MKITIDQVNWLKNCSTILKAWPEELKNWAKENVNELLYVSTSGKVYKCTDVFNDGSCYRLREDYELPKKRWFVNIADCTENDGIYSASTSDLFELFEARVKLGSFMEITEEQLPYYESPETGEWVLKIPTQEDSWVLRTLYGKKGDTVSNQTALPETHRWCKVPEKKPLWKEYPIEAHHGVYYVIGYQGMPKLELRKAQSRVGFGGVWFKGQSFTMWSMQITKMLDSTGILSEYSNGITSLSSPAVPIKVGFWG